MLDSLNKNEKFKIEIVISETILFSQRSKGRYKAQIQSTHDYKKNDMNWMFFAETQEQAFFKAQEKLSEYFTIARSKSIL